VEQRLPTSVTIFCTMEHPLTRLSRVHAESGAAMQDNVRRAATCVL